MVGSGSVGQRRGERARVSGEERGSGSVGRRRGEERGLGYCNYVLQVGNIVAQ